MSIFQNIALMSVEIKKHQGLMDKQDEYLSNVNMGMMMAMIGGVQDEFKVKFESRITDIESRKTHCGLMIRLFQNFIDGDDNKIDPKIMIKKFGVIFNLIKANAFKVMEGMELSTEIDYYTEQEYIDDCARWKGEVELWQGMWDTVKHLGD